MALVTKRNEPLDGIVVAMRLLAAQTVGMMHIEPALAWLPDASTPLTRVLEFDAC